MTDAERAQYGFPAEPPAGSPAYQGWAQAIASAKTYVPPTFTCTNITSEGPAGQQSAGGGTTSSPGSPIAAASGQASSNEAWGGYYTGYSTYHGIQGTWNVPYATGVDDTTSRGAAVWVGVGGWYQGDPTLVQAGVDINTSAGGSANIQSWYEIYPNEYQVDVNLPASQGDTYFVNIAAGSPNIFYLEDESTGQYTHFSDGTATCACTSAEAMEEDYFEGTPVPFTPMTNVNFSNVSPITNDGNVWLSQTSPVASSIYDASCGGLMASPGGVSNGNFSVAESHTSCSPGFGMSNSLGGGTIDVLPGERGTVTIYTTGNWWFDQNVSFSVYVGSSSSSASMSPGSVYVTNVGTQAATLTISRGLLDMSTFTVTVTGTPSSGLRTSTSVSCAI